MAEPHPLMFDPDDPSLARVREIAELIDASFRRTAPTRLVRELDARG